MSLKRLLVPALLIGAATMLFLPGCNNPVDTNQPSSAAGEPLDLPILRHDIKGTHDGFFYQDWDNDKGGSPGYRNEAKGRFTLAWNGTGKDYNFVCGKGWNPARADRVLTYYGTFNPAAASTGEDKCNSMLDFYGWANNCGFEYYVLEGYGEFSPDSPNSGYTYLGEYDSHGIHYHAYYKRQTGPTACGSGNQAFDQLYSVRVPRVGFGTVSGYIYLQDHINKWAEYGYRLNSFQWQIMATEGFVSEYQGSIRPISGNSDITVVEGIVEPPVSTQPLPHPTPTNLQLAAQRHGIYRDLVLNWTRSNSSQVRSYYIYLNGSHIATVPSSSAAWGYHRVYPDQHDTHRFYVRALFIDGALSDQGNTVSYRR